jgi:DNA-binding Lrp family transcriptional regulator
MRAFEASPTLDELDVRILRALVNNRTSAPFSTQVKTSLREIARTLEVDDVTVSYQVGDSFQTRASSVTR